MAEDSLKPRVAAATVVAAGLACELAVSGSIALRAADLAVGGALACTGAVLAPRAPRVALLAFATAVAWFAGTLAAAAVLAYRGPLVQLLLTAPAGRLRGRLAVLAVAAAWLGAFMPLAVAGPVTAGAATLAVALAAWRARTAGRPAARAWLATAAAGAAVATVWWLAVFGAGSDDVLLVLGDAAVVVAALAAATAAAGTWARGASRAIAIELGPTRRPGQPLSTRLGRALADPELEVRYAIGPGTWVDERGAPCPAPDEAGRATTRAPTADGGEVALVHGDVAPERRLAEAAAAAAALALESARLDAQALARRREVEESRRRLLGAADAERRTLERHLLERVVAPLRRTEALLAAQGADVASERAELGAAVDELIALGHGLYPPALARGDLADALRAIAARSPVPASVTVPDALPVLPEAARAAIWFVTSEALANVARHADATSVAVALTADGDELQLEIQDDGRGGATPTRGLVALADRVHALGGTLDIASPTGTGTRLVARLPSGP